MTSPNFPQKYENNIDCTWLIELCIDKFIEIEFLSFDLEHHYNCMLVLPFFFILIRISKRTVLDFAPLCDERQNDIVVLSI